MTCPPSRAMEIAVGKASGTPEASTTRSAPLPNTLATVDRPVPSVASMAVRPVARAMSTRCCIRSRPTTVMPASCSSCAAKLPTSPSPTTTAPAPSSTRALRTAVIATEAIRARIIVWASSSGRTGTTGRVDRSAMA